MRIPRRTAILAVSVLLGWTGWKGLNALLLSGSPPAREKGAQSMALKVQKTDAEWRRSLTPEQYRVMFQCGTEPAFSGAYNDFWEKGTYLCAACGSPLFTSDTKYEHGTGWPSFKAPLAEANILTREDHSYGMQRVEARCAVCGAHLGHVFDDGPPPDGRHYCINSAAMTFRPASESRAASPQVATFAAGCFWGVEDKFGRLQGVLATAVGYSGGTTPNPTYGDVCSDTTGHAESVQVTFDPSRLSYEDLVRAFFRFHDPSQLNRQGPDVGTQYRSVIFFHSPEQKEIAEKVRAELVKNRAYGGRIVTQVIPAETFFRAEEYHQKYFQKNKRGACAL